MKRGSLSTEVRPAFVSIPKTKYGGTKARSNGGINFFDNIPGLGFALGMSINQEGAVTGDYFDRDTGQILSFVRTAGGQVSMIADPNADTGFFQGTEAVSINPAGQIVGSYTDSNYVGHGVLRNP